MSDYLLPELLSKIFLKLPIKSQVQCTAVCKEWRSIIISPAFISAHISLSRQNPLLLTAPTIGIHSPNTFALHFDTDPPLRLSQTIHCPITAGGDYHFRVVGSVDGLIFLTVDFLGYTKTMVLWNPSIRKSITLPWSNFPVNDCPYALMFGFGVDSASGDYKVLRLVYLDGHDGVGPCWKVPPLVEMFSLRDRSWRTVISSNVDYQLVDKYWSQGFLHGAMHWIGWKFGPGRHYTETGILYFDVGKEEFKKMALPKGEKLRPWGFTISVIGGMLSVFAHHRNWGSREHRVNVWVKRDYFADSWMNILSLDFDKLEVGVCLHLRRICGDIVKGMSRGGDAGDCRDIQVPPTCGIRERSFYFVSNYTESLVMLDVSPDEDRAAQAAT